MSKKKSIILRFEKDKDNKYNMHIEGEIKKISGHRFTYLEAMKNKPKDRIVSWKQAVLDFYGLKYTKQNIRMKLGVLLEPYLIEYIYGGQYYITFDNEEERGNAFYNGTNSDINGLPDAILPDINTLVEVKCTTELFYKTKPYWNKQSQFYAYHWNKERSEDTNIEINKIVIIKYYVPHHLLEWQLKNYDTILEDHIETFEIPLDTEVINNDMKKVRKTRDAIKEKPTIKFNINRSNYLKDGIVNLMTNSNTRVTMKYDKEDIDMCEYISNIKNKVKYIRNKRKGI